MWEKIDLMFPQGGTIIEGVFYSNQAIKNSNLDTIINYITKPVRKMTENILRYTYHSNGDLEVRKIYDVFPLENIDNSPVLNVYGQKMLNNIIGEINE